MSHTGTEGTFRVGRFLSASGVNVAVPAHLVRTASSRRSETAAATGQFFEWGIQYQRAFGKFELMADFGDNVGQPYRQMSFRALAVSGRLCYKFDSKESYVSIGGRSGNGARYLSLDSGYNFGKFFTQNFVYYSADELVGRKITGSSFLEWRGISPLIALHLQADMPIKGSSIGTAGISVGKLKRIYGVVDLEWPLQPSEWSGRRSWLAAKLQVRHDF